MGATVRPVARRREVQFPPRPEDHYSAPIGALSSTLDGTFFALSDPTRRGILERLGRGPQREFYGQDTAGWIDDERS
jgi:hypothetical protein